MPPQILISFRHQNITCYLERHVSIWVIGKAHIDDNKLNITRLVANVGTRWHHGDAGIDVKQSGTGTTTEDVGYDVVDKNTAICIHS